MKHITLILGFALLLCGMANAKADNFPETKLAGRAFDIAAKKQFGSGGFVGPVRLYKDPDIPADSVSIMVNPRYLGLPDGHLYLACRYRTNPIRFYQCSSWEGD